MSDKLQEQIEKFFQCKGYTNAEIGSRDAAELAALLRRKSTEWNWEHIKSARRNVGFYVTIVGVIISVCFVILLETGGAIGPLDDKELQKLLVGVWLIAPPVWLFFELYFRGNDKAAREELKAYHEAAQRIWVAVAAVLAGLYGLSLK